MSGTAQQIAPGHLPPCRRVRRFRPFQLGLRKQGALGHSLLSQFPGYFRQRESRRKRGAGGADQSKSVVEKYSETRRFWAKARLEVMSRCGIGWEDLAGMEIEQFFYILHVTEPKKESEIIKLAKGKPGKSKK